jgi:hypothetical protein
MKGKDYKDIAIVKSNQFRGYLVISTKSKRTLGHIRYIPHKGNYYFMPTQCGLGRSIIKSIYEFLGSLKEELKLENSNNT